MKNELGFHLPFPVSGEPQGIDELGVTRSMPRESHQSRYPCRSQDQRTVDLTLIAACAIVAGAKFSIVSFALRGQSVEVLDCGDMAATRQDAFRRLRLSDLIHERDLVPPLPPESIDASRSRKFGTAEGTW